MSLNELKRNELFLRESFNEYFKSNVTFADSLALDNNVQKFTTIIRQTNIRGKSFTILLPASPESQKTSSAI